MITLETIRNRAGILVAVFIGFALFAFIITDFLSSGKSILRGTQNKVAEINNESVEIGAFQDRISQMEEFAKLNQNSSSLGEAAINSIRQNAWDDLIQDQLMSVRYSDLGISVSGAELADMSYGKELNPSIRQMFTNPDTKQFDKERVLNFLRNKNQDPKASFFWSVFEKQMIKERAFNKYKTILRKGLYVTKSQAASEAKAKSSSVDFDFVAKTYASIPDNSVTISESEISNYYKENKAAFKQSPNRSIEFVTFPILPSAEDVKMANDQISKLKVDFVANTGDAFQFARLNSDGNVDDNNYSLNQVPQTLRTFVSTEAVGSVFGVYKEDETLKITKLVSIKQLPDSVKARHILISGNDAKAKAKADSLLSLIKRGADFGVIARTNSTDRGSAANGGDLGWFKEGAMVKPFNDACFKSPKGTIVSVESQFGIHIIEVLELGKLVTKYSLATIDKKINYSSRTYQNVYAKATKFALDNATREKFEAASKRDNLLLTPVIGLTANATVVSNLDSPRELVKWAFGANAGELSPVNEFGNKFVLAAITSIDEEEYKSLSNAKYEITQILLKEKKGEKLVAELSQTAKSASTLSAVAQSAGVNVQSASGINFGSYQIPGAGSEPALVTLAVYTSVGKISSAVKGNNGVFVVKATNSAPIAGNVDSERMHIAQSNGYKVEYKAFEAIKEGASITDNRARFY